MKLTAFTDYSLRVLMYVGLQDGRTCTISEVASAFGISENHLTKVAHFLGKAGLLRNVRGKGGGMTLARPAAEIHIGAVVRETEGESFGAECFEADGGDCCLAPACRLKDVLSEAFEAFYAVLERYTLADVIANRDGLIPLLPAWVPMKVLARDAARGGALA